MPFNLLYDIYESSQLGLTEKITWRKNLNSTYSAGSWNDLSSMAGVPVGNSWAGTALTWTPCDETSGNGTDIFGMRHGGNVLPRTKHILSSSTMGTAAACMLMLVDMQGYYPGINMNTASSQTLSGSPTLRYASGAGVNAYLVVTSSPGLTAHNVTINYVNQDGTSGRSTPFTVACTPGAAVTNITHAGNTANKYGPFLPLQSGDFGIRSVSSIQLSAASGSGSAALVLAKPLLSVPFLSTNYDTERDFVNQVCSLPQVKDGACLTWIILAGSTLSSGSYYHGSIDVVWS